MQWAPPPVQESGGSGQAGFVLALIGVAMVAIPPLPITIMFTVLGWLLLLLGLIFSLVGYARGRRGSKPVAGIWTSCAGFALGIGWAIFWSML